MNLYIMWCQTCGLDPFPLTEQKPLDYCNFLCQSCAPATRADSFVKAARATIDLLSMRCSHYDTSSTRIKGVVLRCSDTKRELQQAAALPAKGISILEHAIFNKSFPRAKRIVAGFVRFCIGARLRF